ncbi:MAG: hypothetical protein ACJAYE_001168 [Candidatus Azotimanducaceae bacterium]|jgi:hypothetical protein
MALLFGQWLLIVGAGIFGILGTAHLIFTFFSDKFEAFDDSVTKAMQRTSPRISKDTSMWQAWVGFNASHSLGAMVFAGLYIPIAFSHFELIQESLWLAVLPVIVGVAYLILAKLYWFRVPFTGILIATLCFIAALYLRYT